MFLRVIINFTLARLKKKKDCI